MDRFIMYPVAFVTTIQPWIALWVLVTSFFVTMAAVALASRGRTLKQLFWMSLLGYPAIVVAVGVGAALFTGWSMLQFEVVHVTPTALH